MNIIKHILLVSIKLYKYIVSPLLPNSCRYLPSCSDYGCDAIKIHGSFKGGWLILIRILRCNPFAGYGYDPVPTHYNFNLGSYSSAVGDHLRFLKEALYSSALNITSSNNTSNTSPYLEVLNNNKPL